MPAARAGGHAARLALVSALAACSGATVEQPPPAPVDWSTLKERPAPDGGAVVTENERALPQAYAASLAQPGLPDLGALLDDDARLTFPGLDDAHGRTSVVRAHELLFGPFDGRRLAITRVWRTPSEQTIEWVMGGTQERPWMGVSARHKPVAFKGLTLLFTRDDGSIVDVHVYFDVAAVKAQLGAGPRGLVAPPPADMPVGEPRVFEQASGADDAVQASTARARLDALEANDESAYTAPIADDLELYTLERADPVRGKEGARAYFRAMRRAVGQLDTTVDDAWSVGPFVVMEYTVAGEQLGTIGWLPPQRDTVVRFHLADVIEFRGAQIAHIWRFDDPEEAVVPSR